MENNTLQTYVQLSYDNYTKIFLSIGFELFYIYIHTCTKLFFV